MAWLTNLEWRGAALGLLMASVVGCSKQPPKVEPTAFYACTGAYVVRENGETKSEEKDEIALMTEGQKLTYSGSTLVISGSANICPGNAMEFDFDTRSCSEPSSDTDVRVLGHFNRILGKLDVFSDSKQGLYTCKQQKPVP